MNLISNATARVKLEEAYAALVAHNHENALASAATAFILVQHVHDQNQASTFPLHAPISLRDRTSRNTFTDFAINDIERALGSEISQSVRRIVESSRHAIETLSEAVEMLSYGLDLKAYLLFRTYIPIVHQYPGGTLTVQWMQQPTQDGDIVARCLDFVVDAAVKFGI